jgi:hypothetical protein
MKLLTALAALSFHIAQGRRLQTDTVPAYIPEECDTWFAGGSAFDADASGGLSSDEYFAVLSSLGQTGLAMSYAELDLYAKISFTTMACSCVSLGLGKDCCAGEDAEISLPVRSSVDDPALDASYVTNLCSVLTSVIVVGSTPPPVAAPSTRSPLAVGATESPTPTSPAPPTVTDPTSSVIFDILGVVAGFDAAEILANEGANDVLAQITEGFEVLSNEVSSTMEPVRRARGLRAYKRKLVEMESVEVSDICESTKCRSTNVIF